MSGYDPACGDLARHFLGDLASDRLVKELAQHIQDQVESWIEYEQAALEAALARKPQ
jgi:hypothetical protein